MYIAIFAINVHNENIGVALNMDSIQSRNLLYQFLLCDDKLRRPPVRGKIFRNWWKV